MSGRLPPHECRLRTTAGLRGSPAVALSAWRGFSGRRYVVSVWDVERRQVEDRLPAVLLGVSRDNRGIAQIERAEVAITEDVHETIGRFRACGATEIHCHMLADGASERAAVVADLQVAS